VENSRRQSYHCEESLLRGIGGKVFEEKTEKRYRESAFGKSSRRKDRRLFPKKERGGAALRRPVRGGRKYPRAQEKTLIMPSSEKG